MMIGVAVLVVLIGFAIDCSLFYYYRIYQFYCDIYAGDSRLFYPFILLQQ